MRRTFLMTVLAIGVVTAAQVAAQTSVVVSAAADGTNGNGLSYGGKVGNDGAFVVFASAATNLVPGDTNGADDVFIKFPATGAVARVSVDGGGNEHTGNSGSEFDASDDGQLVVFASYAALVPGDTNTCGDPTSSCQDIYVHNRATGATTRVSLSSLGVQANGASQAPRISGDGRFVVFSSLASNLVANDTNGVEDVFLHDLTTHTTTRISVRSDGAQGTGASRSPSISADGAVVGFLADGSSLADPAEPDPLPCEFTSCERAYVHQRDTARTSRIAIDNSPSTTSRDVRSIQLDAAGRVAILGLVRFRGPFSTPSELLLHNRLTGRNQLVHQANSRGDFGPWAFISGDGNIVVARTDAGLISNPMTSYLDRRRGIAHADSFVGPMSYDGMKYLLADQSGSTQQLRLYNRDEDADGMDPDWELHYGFDPANGNDGALDADGDGRTNAEEYAAGTHPKYGVRRYLAEGAANSFFTTRLALFNPGETNTTASITLLGTSGNSTTMLETLYSKQRKTVLLDRVANIPDDTFSTIIESEQPVVVDRTMTWDDSGYGAHAETSIEAPATTWYFAEGATHGQFNLFYLLQNANDVEAHVSVTYLRLAPNAPVVKTYTVAPNTRRTIWVDDEGPELSRMEMAAAIASDVPIIAERAMYADTPTQAFAAGHEGAGVTAPANRWFLAEGATGVFFDTYVLIGNPGTTASQLTVSYLLPNGQRFSKPYVVGPQNRLTISVDGEDPRLADTPVSVIVDSTNNQPVVVERAMWWPSPNWYEAHLSAGTTTTGTTWALAEGEVGTSTTPTGETETYILIANTGDSAGTATVTFYPEIDLASPFSTAPIVTTLALPPNSRTSVPVSSAITHRARFATIVESDGVPIVVERAMYTSANGVTWTAGTDALATRLQ